MKARRVAIVAAVLGVLGGLVLALALPREPEATAVARASAPEVAGSGVVGRAPEEARFELRPGSVRLALRVADPEGRAPWAVRLLESRAVIPRPGRAARRLAWTRCAQLGRLVAGRFGWITEARGFTPVAATDQTGAPAVCHTPRRLAGRDAATALVTLVRTDRAGQPAPARTVAFGRLGPNATGVELRDRGRPVTGRMAGEAFLTFARADPGVRDLRLRIAFARGRALDRDLSGAVPITELPRVTRRFQGQPQPGSERVVARAPDPAGGAPYGVLAVRSSRPGQWCPGQSTRVLGQRGGYLDNRLETFRAGLSGFFCGDDRYPLTRRRPVTLSLSGTGAQPGQEAAAGRLQRRSLPGTTVLSGVAHRDVRTLEIVTSRDLRTLTPDPLTGSFVTAYDGNLPGEEVSVTATLTDGTRRTTGLPTGF